jgi:Fe-S oxidoreductase
MLEKCHNCGLCKALCPVLAAERCETTGPRGKVLLLKSNVHTDLLFKCTLCRACEVSCPLHLDIPAEVRRARRTLKTKANEEMIKNVRKTSNVFGKKTGDEIKRLQCC